MFRTLTPSLFLLVVVLTSACSPLSYYGNNQQFKGKYTSFLNEDETELRSWYHFVYSERSDGTFIKRTFFPETMTLTHYEEFKEDCSAVRNGRAKYYWDDGTPHSEGNFVNDQHEGLWHYYRRKTGIKGREGLYKKGKETGEWSYYHNSGRIKSVYSYQNGMKHGPFIVYDTLQEITNEGMYASDSLLYQSKIIEPDYETDEAIGKSEEMPYLSKCKSILSKDERNACSQKTLLTYIYSNLKYPQKARELNLSGTVIVRFVIDKDGSVDDIEVIRGVNQFFKEAVLDVVVDMPSWEPGVQKGRKVKVLYTLPVKFKLS